MTAVAPRTVGNPIVVATGIDQGQASAAAPPVPPASPVTGRDRQGLLDALRGISLLGILMVNMQFFAAADGYDLDRFDGWVDRTVLWFILLVAQGKFYLLFSLLFGYGLAVQLDRAGEQDAAFGRRYRRRLAGLALLGLVHGMLFFVGDILVPYALLGSILYLFRRSTADRLLRWCIGLLIAGVVLLIAVGVLFASQLESATAQPSVSATGAWPERLLDRAVTLGETYAFLAVLQWPSALAMFLLGLYAGRRGIFKRPDEHRPLFGEWLRWGGVVGAIGAVITATTGLMGGDWEGVSILVETATAPGLTLAYVAAVALLISRTGWRARFARFEVLGRMSLSNYLLQSIVCATIFANWGFGLHDRIGPTLGLVLTLGIWVAQIPLSVWWMRRFRFGPAEWLLRSFTYRRWQPLRLPKPA